VCGGRDFVFSKVIWQELATEWQLTPEETAYIDRQQGGRCADCGMNFRSMALASAIGQWLGIRGPLRSALARGERRVRILEINEAGMLTPLLRSTADWTLAAYPEVDIHALPYPDETFDLVVHSDTLEHVEEPIRGLSECRRVLKAGGACCYTVPMIVGRMSRSRAGLTPSHHGSAEDGRPDLIVHTEFGVDAWTYPVRAGFDRVSLVAFDYPAAVAFVCEMGGADRL
jgi:SAM-dependent methyltransferase